MVRRAVEGFEGQTPRPVREVADELLDESVRLLRKELARHIPEANTATAIAAIKRDVLSLWAINLLEFGLVQGELSSVLINEWLHEKLGSTRFLLDDRGRG